jgi:hypothetical protein
LQKAKKNKDLTAGQRVDAEKAKPIGSGSGNNLLRSRPASGSSNHRRDEYQSLTSNPRGDAADHTTNRATGLFGSSFFPSISKPSAAPPAAHTLRYGL